MSIFRMQLKILLPAAKSALSILTVKYRVSLTSLSSALRKLTAPNTEFVEILYKMINVTVQDISEAGAW